MSEKYCCVVDTVGKYITYVLVVDGQVQNYNLKDGETLISARPPMLRPCAGETGLVSPAWNGSQWEESATEAELAEWEERHQIEPDMLAANARAKRAKLLADTDWTQVLDAPIDAATREAYRAYRQALRDIPEQEGFPAAITWPELPAVTKADPDPVDTAVDTMLGGETA